MSKEFTYCPYCSGRIHPGQVVVEVDDPDLFRSLWHKACRYLWLCED